MGATGLRRQNDISPPAGPSGASAHPVRNDHYDRFPYEVGTDGGACYLTLPGALGEFLRSVEGHVVVDIGCGPANMLRALAGSTRYAIGVDISPVTLRLAQRRLQGAPSPAAVLQADALRLPLRDGAVDGALAVGSLHHTGHARQGFSELCRVLRPGGRALVAVYRAGSYYAVLYGSVGRLARSCHRHRLADVIVNRVLLLPLFALYMVCGRLIAHRRLAVPRWQQLCNYYADQLLNPVVSFHSRSELQAWADAEGVVVTGRSTTHAGALETVVVSKPGLPPHARGYTAPAGSHEALS